MDPALPASPAPLSAAPMPITGAAADLRSLLRDGTAPAHERLDRLFAPLASAAPAHLYHCLVRTNHAGHEAIDRAVAARATARAQALWATREDLLPALRADMAAMRLAPLDAPTLRLARLDSAEVAGLLYVVEGSRLGARFVRRAVAAEPAPARRAPLATAWLDRAAAPARFGDTMAQLSTQIADPAAQQRALDAACAAFALFEAAALAATADGAARTAP